MGLRKWGGLRVWGDAAKVDLTITSTLPSLQSSTQLSQSVGGNTASISSTLPSLISSVEIQSLSVGKVAVISSTMPSLVSSATFDKLEPRILNVSIASTLPSLTSNVHFYNGILDVRIGKGNNINVVVKSRTIDTNTKERYS